ncbi:Rap1a/Tai family immunity protein [Burkholderia multivorans]|uniref:Rap1a/Tai family immunity protein n=1 Tax=Burkholderia multivorans TaxID=87883 RepID=UPI00345E5B44
MKKTFLAVASIVTCANSFALDGKLFLQLSQSGRSEDQLFLEGYTAAAYDAAGGITRNTLSLSARCRIDPLIPQDQMVAIVSKYISDNPSVLQESAAELTIDAMNSAYCPTAPTQRQSRERMATFVMDYWKYRAKYGPLK